MRSKFGLFKIKATELRKSGKTYGEIRNIIGKNIPKSTLSLWCNKIYLTSEQKKMIDKKVIENCKKGMEVAWIVNRERRKKYLNSIIDRNKHLVKIFQNKDINKIALSMLYLGEGSKGLNRGSLRFGNSDPFVVDLFCSSH